MSENMKTNAAGKPVTVVVGATSKWQSDGRNTKLAHGTFLDDSDIPVGVRWVSAAPSHRSSRRKASLPC